MYKSSPDTNITTYSDSDWAIDINTRRSVTGCVVFFGCNPISWQSNKHSSVSRSSIEAKYKALAHCATDVCWLRSLPKDLHMFIPSHPVLHCVNLSTIILSSNPVFHSCMKHRNTDFHFVREKVQKGDLLVQHISTKEQAAYILTKDLHGPSFVHHCYNLNLGAPG